MRETAAGDATERALEFKPDFAESYRRWGAYLAGELIDRPPVIIAVARPGAVLPPDPSYRDMIEGDFDDIVSRRLERAAGTYYAGDAVPSFFPSFGCDEPAVFCSPDATLEFNDASAHTNWIDRHWIEDWDSALPLAINERHPLWRRMLALCAFASERIAGKMLMTHIDLHTNMDLLAPARGAQRLCMDLIDRPEAIDRAMASAREVFRKLWRDVVEAGRMDEVGYCAAFPSFEGAAVLQCDFSIMISPDMFARWVAPALEEEASLVRHAYYHWDGAGALVHKDVLFGIRGLHTLGFLPGEGKGRHIDYLDVLKECQRAGKAVHVGGTLAECQAMHRELAPDRVIYSPSVATPAEADAAVEWFRANT